VKFHLNNTKGKWNRHWEGGEKKLKSAANESLGTIKRWKVFKNMGWPNKTINRNKEKSYKKWLNSKKLEDKLEYKRNTALAKREVRGRQRLPWDRFVTNLEHETYPKCTKF